MKPADEERATMLATMGRIFEVLEQLDDDETRLRVLGSACAMLGLYDDAQRFLASARTRARNAGGGEERSR